MESLLHWSDRTLFLCALALAASVVLAYPLAELLPMSGQVSAHISILLFATGIKLAYIARIMSLKALHRPVH